MYGAPESAKHFTADGAQFISFCPPSYEAGVIIIYLFFLL